MPLSNKERQKAYYDRHKGNAEYKLKRTIKEKKKRDSIKGNAILRQKIKLQARERIRKWRLSKKLAKQDDEMIEGYKSRSSLGKAVNRLISALPSSSAKRVAVVNKFCQQVGLPDKKLPSKLKTTDTNLELVQKFFQREEFTWTSPNVKNVTKLGVQKQYLVIPIMEVYSLFKQEYQDVKIGKSKFAEFRPSHVKPKQFLPHNQCLCIYHQNINLILEKLKPHAAIIPARADLFVDLLCCDSSSADCLYYQTCSICASELSISSNIFPTNINWDAQVSWEQWKTISGKVQIVKSSGTLLELISVLSRLLPYFKKHSYVNRVQKKYFRTTRANLSNDDSIAVIQVDFAENFSIRKQDEIQSAYFLNEQISVFTIVVWLKNNTFSLAYVSDELNHDKYAVYVYLNKLFSWLKSEHSALKVIHIFSDGAASQFKQRFTISSMLILSKFYNVDLSWHFFATAHGKGAVDGIGAVVKSQAWRFIKSKQFVICNAHDLESALSKSKVLVHHVDKDTINQSRQFLDKYWNDTEKFPDIKSNHSFCVILNMIVIKLFSIENGGQVYNPTKSMLDIVKEVSDITKMQPGDLVKVNRCGSDCPGKIQLINFDCSVAVSCMRSVGSNNMWTWPIREDIYICNAHQVISLAPMILTPVGTSNRISHYELLKG